ncbi:MAG: hypothetical protein ACREAM_25675, partial [Blastocatellia bacterium]
LVQDPRRSVRARTHGVGGTASASAAKPSRVAAVSRALLITLLNALMTPSDRHKSNVSSTST